MPVTSGYDSAGVEIGGLASGQPAILGTSVSGALQMSLLALNKVVDIGTAGLISSAYNPTFDKWDAVAKCDVPVNSFKEMFVIQSDGIDIDDVSNNDIRFYVDNTKIPTITNVPLGTAVVNNGAMTLVNALGQTITGLDQVIAKDYVRHLANLLFNTPYGADLFINESDLVSSVNTGLGQIWTSCVTDLTDISIVGTHAKLQGNTGHKYLLRGSAEDDTTYDNTYNICRELFRMLLSRAPARFTDPATDLSGNRVPSAQAALIDPNADNLSYLPLLAGDQILMRAVLKPAATQDSFQNSTAEDTIVRDDMRAYILVLNLV